MTTSAKTAGRELDALIAEQVMGWTLFAGNRNYREDGEPVPRYSTEIAAAWLVWERLTSAGHLVVLRSKSAITGQPRVELTGLHPVRRNEWLVTAEAATMPLAICLVALAAVEVQPLTVEVKP